MSWIKNKLISILIILISCFLAFVLMELFLRALNINSWENIAREAHILRNIEIKSDISKLYSSEEKFADYSLNEFGLRDNCKNTQEIEILTIGGSTPAQKNVPFKYTYQSVLEKRLKEHYEGFGCVTNAGIDGHSTWGHLYSFKNWFSLIPDLRPKFVLLYIGINDVDLRTTNTPNSFDKSRLNSFNNYLKNFETIKSLLPIVRYFHQKFLNSEPQFARHIRSENSADKYIVPFLNYQTKKLSKLSSAAFKLRMIRILRYIEDLNSIPICVTQPHMYVMEKNGWEYGQPNIVSEGFSGLDFDFFIKEINSIILELCGENTLNLYDHDFQSIHFYDGIHTTDKGSIEVGEEMASFIISNFY